MDILHPEFLLFLSCAAKPFKPYLIIQTIKLLTEIAETIIPQILSIIFLQIMKKNYKLL